MYNPRLIDPRWMWENPKECEKCGRDLTSHIEIERGICDDCAYDEAQETINRLRENKDEN